MVANRSRFSKERGSSRAKKVFSWLLLLLGGLVAASLLFYNLLLHQKRSGLEERTQELQTRIAELSQRSQELREQAQAAETEAYQERILREQGLYQKPGEEVVTILPAEDADEEDREEKRVWWNPFTWF